MNNIARQTLCDLVAKHGIGLGGDAKRCEGLLRDHCGAYTREINVLINALEERIGLDLLAANRSMPLELLLTKLEKRLEDHLAVTPDAARWAVNSWALALGVAADQDVARREKIAAKTFEPRVPASGQPKPPQEFDHNKSQQPPQPQRQSSKPPVAPKQPPPFAPPPNAPKVNPLPPPAANSGIAPRVNQTPTLPKTNAQAAPQANQTGFPTPRNQSTQNQRAAARTSRAWFTFRGCFVGCFLLLVILSVLIVGVPYAFRVMRETQQRTEPPRLPR